MDTSTISNKQAKRAMEWRERVARHAASGLDVASFCARESVSKANFYRWRALISDQPCVNAVAGPTAFIDLGAMRGGAVNAPRAASDDVIESGAIEVSLDLGHGLTLRILRR